MVTRFTPIDSVLYLCSVSLFSSLFTGKAKCGSGRVKATIWKGIQLGAMVIGLESGWVSCVALLYRDILAGPRWNDCLMINRCSIKPKSSLWGTHVITGCVKTKSFGKRETWQYSLGRGCHRTRWCRTAGSHVYGLKTSNWGVNLTELER